MNNQAIEAMLLTLLLFGSALIVIVLIFVFIALAKWENQEKKESEKYINKIKDMR